MSGNGLSGGVLNGPVFDPTKLMVTKTADTRPAMVAVLDRARGVMERQSTLTLRVEKAADNLLGAEPENDMVAGVPEPPCAGMVGEVAITLEHMVNTLNLLERAVGRLERALG